MQFADPRVCPECRGPIKADSACPRCGLDLTSAPARALWQTLLHADQQLASARALPRKSSQSPPAQPQQPEQPQQPAQPAATQHSVPVFEDQPRQRPTYLSPSASHTNQEEPAAGEPAQMERRWSVGTIILALGTFGMIAAGIIFVTTSWDNFNLVERTLVLIAVTAVVGALGAWVTIQKLRTSSEAIWSVFLALLTLDFFAARHEGIAGLGHVDLAWACLVWGIVLLDAGLLLIAGCRSRLGVDLVAALIGSVFGIYLGAIGTYAIADGLEAAWRPVLALIVAGLLSLCTRAVNNRVLTLVSRITVALFYVFAYIVGTIDVAWHSKLDDLVAGGHGGPLLLLAVVAVVVAVLVPILRIPAVALAVVAPCVLILAPLSTWRQEGLWAGLAVLSAVLAVAAWRGTNAWLRGVRLGSVPVVAGLVLVVIAWFGSVIFVCAQASSEIWNGNWNGRLDPQPYAGIGLWAIPFVLIGWLVVAWFVLRWPEALKVNVPATAVFNASIGLVVTEAVVIGRAPMWIALVVLMVAAAALTSAARDKRRQTGDLAVTATVLVLVASLIALADAGTSALAWLAGAAIVGALATYDTNSWIRHGAAAISAILLLGTVAATARVLDGQQSATFLAVLVVALTLIAFAGIVAKDHLVRPTIEIVGALGTVIASFAPGSTNALTVRWTITGAVLIALSLAATRRKWYLWPGVAALVVAYVLLIVDSGFSFVEAYTLPLGAAALALGLTLFSRDSRTNTWLFLGPGLALSMLPSLPQALADPVGVRALLLGLGAVAALGIGIRMNWQAPFCSGAGVAVLLVLFNIGPYANAAPRVVLIAAVSALLLAVGITWENRVRDSRWLVGYVRSMH